MNEAVIFIIASTLFFPPVPVVTGCKGVPEEEGELYKWLVRGGSLTRTQPRTNAHCGTWSYKNLFWQILLPELGPQDHTITS